VTSWPWPSSADELIDAQRALAAAGAERGGAGATGSWHTRAPHLQPAIGACVVVFPRGQTGAGARGDPAWASAAVLRDGHVLAHATVTGEAAGPYVPGLLALREGPCLEAAVRALAVAPDVLLIDATGRCSRTVRGRAMSAVHVHRCQSTVRASPRGCGRARARGRSRCMPVGERRSMSRSRSCCRARSPIARPSHCVTHAGWRVLRAQTASVGAVKLSRGRAHQIHGRSSARLLPMLGSSVCRN